jgi:hypothetical protein
MKYTDYLDSIILDSIRDDVRRAGHNQFTGANYSAGPAHRRMPGEARHCRYDCLDHSSCSGRTVLSDVLSLGVEIGSRFAKPLNAHGASTS